MVNEVAILDETQAVELPAELKELKSYAVIFLKSGMFPDSKSMSQAIVRIMAGKELGLPPFAAMRGIEIIQGKPVLSAGVTGSLIKRSGRYDYRVRNWTTKGCTVDFHLVKSDSKLDKIGEATFDEADARAAGLLGKENWRKYPKDMYFARALTSGARKFCGDAFGGVTVYDENEVDEIKKVEASGEDKPTLPEGAAADQPEPTDDEVDLENKEKVAKELLEKLDLKPGDRMRALKEATGKAVMPKNRRDWGLLHDHLIQLSEDPSKVTGTEETAEDEPTENA